MSTYVAIFFSSLICKLKKNKVSLLFEISIEETSDAGG